MYECLFPGHEFVGNSDIGIANIGYALPVILAEVYVTVLTARSLPFIPI